MTPSTPDPRQQQFEAREFDRRLALLVEVARVIERRSHRHDALAIQHAQHWLGSWEAQKAQRLRVVARILASPEFAALVRGHPAMRSMFQHAMPPAPAKRPKQPDFRRKRDRRKHREDVDPVEEVLHQNLTDPLMDDLQALISGRG